MYKNIGRKIKILAIVIAVILAIMFIIVGVSRAVNKQVVAAILVIIFGPVISWISSFVLYGFGELVDKTCEIELKISNDRYERLGYLENKLFNKIKKLHSMGLISEEDYQKAVDMHATE